MNEQALINVAAENNPYFNIVPMHIHGLARLASWLYGMELRVTAKKRSWKLTTKQEEEKEWNQAVWRDALYLITKSSLTDIKDNEKKSSFIKYNTTKSKLMLLNVESNMARDL